MRKKRSKRVRRRRRHTDEPESLSSGGTTRKNNESDQPGPQHSDGPVHGLTPLAGKRADREVTEEEGSVGANAVGSEESGVGVGAAVPAQEPLPTLEGEGQPAHAVAFNRSGPLRLRGRTDADFDGGSFRTQNVTVRPGTDCTGCRSRQCIQASGTLEATYSVRTSVSLPSVADFPGLTPCQQRRVQDAIDNVLAPHEQDHVRAFEQYNGTTRRTFDLTLCRSEFDGAITQMFETEASARQQAAQTASDALDPFHFDVDLDCEEPEETAAATPTVTPEMPAGE